MLCFLYVLLFMFCFYMFCFLFFCFASMLFCSNLTFRLPRFYQSNCLPRGKGGKRTSERANAEERKKRKKKRESAEKSPPSQPRGSLARTNQPTPHLQIFCTLESFGRSDWHGRIMHAHLPCDSHTQTLSHLSVIFSHAQLIYR